MKNNMHNKMLHTCHKFSVIYANSEKAIDRYMQKYALALLFWPRLYMNRNANKRGHILVIT